VRLRDDAFYEGLNIEFIRDEVIELDPKGKGVVLKGGRRIGYDRLLLATGSEPSRLPIDGATLPHVKTLRSLADAQAIIDAKAVVAVRRGTAVFVVARLVNPRYADLLADFPDGLGHHEGVITAFDRARAANESQRQLVADFDFVDFAVANFDYFVNHEKHPV
jgi:hypothetical protein